MDKITAQRIVRDTFKAAFDKKRYHHFINELCNGYDEGKARNMAVPDAFKAHVKSCQRLGTFMSADGELADVLIVHLTESYKLDRSRTALRDFVAHKLKRDESYKEAGLVAFVAPDAKSWRFSYVRMEYETKRDPDTGKIKAEERLTPARRFSYLVGVDEECHTAQTRFLALLQNTADKPTLAQIEDAFSVEAVTKEFFEEYKRLFEVTEAELAALVKQNKTLHADFATKHISTADFTKKLLGQIIFLYFIQKKGWLGVAADAKWGEGQRNFLRLLANQAIEKKQNLFNDVLEPLFYDTLATDRGHEAWCDTFQCRIPFLNGGLFEPLAGYDWQNVEIALPNTLLTNRETNKAGDTGTGILDVFDRYNFTVMEDEPLEKEVAIDPEMLGKVFENLLEVKERKSKGSFYTPREIVHYMCQESLINYLDTTLNTGKEIVPRKDIETFVHLGDKISHYEAVEATYKIKMPKSIEHNARPIDEKLRDITVCDPAIGSGAFPVGMMTEIVRARAALTSYFNDVAERTAYYFKRHAIQNSLYGVDIDVGAVEIAKLRLWLSLVVDEEDVQQIKPLPNLDYKIVVGNSLIGFPYKSDRIHDIEKLKRIHFDETDHTKKGVLKEKIDSLIHACFANSKKILGYEVTFDFEIYFSEVFHAKQGFDVVIANPPYISHDKFVEKESLKASFKTYEPFADVYCYFIEKSLAVLKPRGVLSFITSNSYIKANYGLPLRRLLSHQNTILQLLNVEDSQIFQSAIVNVAILLTQQGRLEKETSTLVTNTPCDTTFFREYVSRQSFEISTASFRSPLWCLFPQKILSLKHKIESNGLTLENLNAKIRLGIATGANEAFIINEDQRAAFVKKHKHNAEIIKPVLRGRDIERFAYKHAGCYVLLTKNGINVQHDFPDIYDYLDSFGPNFKRRGAQGQNWFNLRACAFFEDFKKEKIVWIELADRGRFALCSDEMYLVNSAYFLLPPPHINSKYLLAILNSRLIEFYLGLIAETSGMGTTRWINNYVKEFPVVIEKTTDQAAIIKLVDRILLVKLHDAESDTRMLEREIDELVYALYGLTSDEIALIKAAC